MQLGQDTCAQRKGKVGERASESNNSKGRGDKHDPVNSVSARLRPSAAGAAYRRFPQTAGSTMRCPARPGRKSVLTRTGTR